MITKELVEQWAYKSGVDGYDVWDEHAPFRKDLVHMLELAAAHGAEQAKAAMQGASVNQQLLESLTELVPILESWHEDFPDDVGDKEKPALRKAVAAIAAASQEEHASKLESALRQAVDAMLNVAHGDPVYGPEVKAAITAGKEALK